MAYRLSYCIKKILGPAQRNEKLRVREKIAV